MTEEHDEQLKCLFRSSFEEFNEEEFVNRVMDQVTRHERHLGLLSFLAYLTALATTWFLAPEIQSAAMRIAAISLRASPLLAGNQVSPSFLPLFLLLGAACSSYFFINLTSGTSKGNR